MPNGGGSDHTLKMNIAELPEVLKKVLALRPVSWDWKETNEREYGFIAQEVEANMPDLVYTDTWTDGTTRKHISTKELLPYFVGAIQEQQKQIDALRADVRNLKKQDKE